jgi:hypothetical protein
MGLELGLLGCIVTRNNVKRFRLYVKVMSFYRYSTCVFMGEFTGFCVLLSGFLEAPSEIF